MSLNGRERDLFRRFTRDPEPEFQGWLRRQFSPNTLRLNGSQIVGDTGWLSASFATNWTDFDASHLVQYRKDPFGRVTLQGIGKRTTTTYSYPSTVFTLPSGYRPAQDSTFIQKRLSTSDGFPYPAQVAIIASSGAVQLFDRLYSGAGVADTDTGAVGNAVWFYGISFFNT